LEKIVDKVVGKYKMTKKSTHFFFGFLEKNIFLCFR